MLRLSTSHLYALLARLERDGLVAGTTEESSSRPARHVYHLTDAGRDVVLRRVDEPVARPRDVLVDFPLKLYLDRRLGSTRATALVARQCAVFTAYLQQLEHTAAPCGGEDAAFMALVREGRIARTRIVLDWLDRCAADHDSYQPSAISRQLKAES